MSRSGVGSPEHIYYEVVLPNGYRAPNYPNADAVETDQRNTAIITSPSQFEVSILRLQIPGGCIPIKVMEMAWQGGANIRDTIYTLEMSLGASNATTRIQWETEDDTAPFPASLDNRTIYPEYAAYYSMRSFNTWARMVNSAMVVAFGALAGRTVGTIAPFITYDGTAELFTLWVDSVSALTDNLVIRFNQPLKNVFGSTWHAVKTLSPIGGEVAYQIVLPLIPGTEIPPAYPGRPFYAYKQEYQNVNTSDFSSLASIFVTSDMATRLQLEPNFLQDGQGTVSRGSANQQRNVLTNFGITNGNVRQDIVYVPSSEYRRIELLNSQPIYSIRMAIFWEDYSGNLYPICVPAGKAANMLLLFEKITGNWHGN
jgi:hypothetical protein